MVSGWVGWKDSKDAWVGCCSGGSLAVHKGIIAMIPDIVTADP